MSHLCLMHFFDALERDLEPTLAVPALSAARGQQSAPEAGGRRVVLIPASPEGTPRSIQDVQSSLLCNRFAVLADDNVDDLTEDQPTEFPTVRTMEDLGAGARSESEERQEAVGVDWHHGEGGCHPSPSSSTC